MGLRALGAALLARRRPRLALIAVWFLMLVVQGEGLGVDLQRRRNPMWEWLLSYPVDPRAGSWARCCRPSRPTRSC